MKQVGSPSPQIQEPQKPNFTAIIVKLEPASYGRCCLCNYRGPLRYCLEYFNSEGSMILWGDVCQNCADKFQKKGD
jgi:hypothetical protein